MSGIVGSRQRAGGRRPARARVDRAGGGLEPPALRVVVPVGLLDLDAEADVRGEAVLVGDAARGRRRSRAAARRSSSSPGSARSENE